ncbi:riboflavin biosynthesis protein RibF [Atribacter laminatus]|jgi:riboflavin kinase/FMN adenylyltransferase|uniref:Riboflavin biosynthesis protein n=1 Tax=Atribacter laminatus TaxID=2847778 RepID=A0A7T1F3M3_ATRLM|nr:riboflavin biosynthesis protein RibF [Atribacter laminatus]QPM69263.1 Riboflavin biosynthesis protein RibF [Atribacter laminatus]
MLSKSYPKDYLESVVALGFFDGIHLGHQAVLNRAATIAAEKEKPLRIITFYPHPRNSIGHNHTIKYITTYAEKYQCFQSFYPGCEVYFLRFNRQLRHTSSESFLDRINQWFRPIAVITGENFRFGYRTQGDQIFLQNFFKKRGVETAIIPSISLDGDVLSSTMVRQLIEKGDIKKVNKVLGYPFSIRGRIVKGKQIGSQIGFPTANLLPVSSKIMPPHGVYFGFMNWKKGEYPALIYIGTKPTVSQNQRRVVEVHISHQICQSLYQERITVQLQHFWRLEKHFLTIEALKEQITIDQAAFNAYLQHTQGMIN